MMERGMHKIVIVSRKTRLQELVHQYNTVEQAKFYIEHMGVDFSDYIVEDRQYHQVLELVRDTAEHFARVQEIERQFVPNMIFGKQDIVIAVGQDGLVANVMKYLDGQPLLGINPDTARWEGVLLPFEARQLKEILPKVIQRKHQERQITMAEAVAKDGQSMLAVNDLFVGCRTHTSARYDIMWNGEQENQSSSGIIISTGLGATGWYQSVMAQAKRMTELFGCGKIVDKPLAWDDSRLTFVVREPYPSRTTQVGIVFGKIEAEDEFRVISKMPENGVIFSDGIEEDAISFRAGTEIAVRIAKRKGKLVV
ncbi:MAG: sugar kinase [Lachnospiraceae bacterium]|nr:sugar kinase [Lachnospiraceae bacterium]